MSEKPIEQFTSPVERIERLEEIECPENKENFEGQKVLVIGGPDAHGVSMAVSSAQYLEKRGAEAVIYVGSPVIREGKGATHPGAFYTKTIPALSVEGYDRVVISDIPLDFRNLENSEKAIASLDERIRKDRERRGLSSIEHSTFYIDHHSTTKFANPVDSAVVKNVQIAEACKLGNEKTIIGRIGAICDRDVPTLPVTDEEMILARGLDAAVRPDPDDERPKLSKSATEEEKQTYQEQLRAWEDRVQARLEETVRRLKAEDWDYFKKEAERMSRVEIPTASGFGQIAIVDTQDLTSKLGVLKLMEMAVENAGTEKTPYAIGILRELGDIKMGREPADAITIIRHWTMENLPSVEEIITRHFGEDFIERYKMYGAKNAKTVRLPVNDRETAKIAAQLVEAFAGQEMPDFSQVCSVVMCGDPNSGKSVYSTIFREALKTLGVHVTHLDLDKAAPTPQWYLDAEIASKEAKLLFSQGKLSQEKLDEIKNKLEEAAEKRRTMKRPWSIDLAEEAKQELVSATQEEKTDFVIGDIGGGRIKKDEAGKIVKITRLTAENARILEGTDAVIIVSNNPQGAAEWKKLIETGIDPETGVQIKRDKPIQIIGIYQSILEGNIQETATGEKTGIITNLDRSKAKKKYNPVIFTTAMFVSEAVERKKGIIQLKQQLEQAGVDISSWGTGKAKTLKDLKKEIESGETVLVTGKEGNLLRKVVVGRSDIYYQSPDGKRYRLKEDKQVFKDGRERRRELGVAVSEKMKPSEEPTDAMIRGIQEELGIKGEITLTEIGTDEQTTSSPSYLGLKSQYIRHKFEAVLSVEQFNPDGYVEEQKDKSTYFVWEEVK